MCRHKTRVIRIYVAAPKDCLEERRLIQEVVRSLNQEFEKERICLEALRPNVDPVPGMIPTGQSLIDFVISQTSDGFEVFVGFMRDLRGTPLSPRFESGTEEELETAIELWRLDDSQQVLFFFCNSSPEAPGQERRATSVLEFEKRLRAIALAGEYSDPSNLKEQLREKLRAAVRSFLAAERRKRGTWTAIASAVTLLLLGWMSHAISEWHLERWPGSPPGSFVGSASDRALAGANMVACAATVALLTGLLVLDPIKCGRNGLDRGMRHFVIVPLIAGFTVWGFQYTIPSLEVGTAAAAIERWCDYFVAALFALSGLTLLLRERRAHPAVERVLRPRERKSTRGMAALNGVLCAIVLTALLGMVGATAWRLASASNAAPAANAIPASAAFDPFTGVPAVVPAEQPRGSSELAEGITLQATGVFSLLLLALGFFKCLNMRSLNVNTMLPSVALFLIALLQSYLIFNPHRESCVELGLALLVGHMLKLSFFFSLVVVIVATMKMYEERARK